MSLYLLFPALLLLFAATWWTCGFFLDLERDGRWGHTLNVIGRPGRLPGVLAKARWVIRRHLLRYDYEVCHHCGRPVRLVWHAPDTMWGRHSWPLAGLGGVLCIPCFDESARAAGESLIWRPEVDGG